MRQAANGSDERRQLTALFCDLVPRESLDADSWHRAERRRNKRLSQTGAPPVRSKPGESKPPLTAR
jgi:hypothetical protein